MTKKQLQRKVAALERQQSDKEGGSVSGNDLNTNNDSSSDSFSLDQVRAMISVAKQEQLEAMQTQKRQSDQRQADAYTAASLQLQQVMKRQKH